MKKILCVLLTVIWGMGLSALADEAAKIEMPVYACEYPQALEEILAADAHEDALAALFLLEAENHLENFDMEAVTGVYWLQDAEAPCLLVFHQGGFWHIGMQDMTFSAYATQMEGIEDLDGLIAYLKEEKGRVYEEADVEAGFAQLAEIGISIEEKEE